MSTPRHASPARHRQRRDATGPRRRPGRLISRIGIATAALICCVGVVIGTQTGNSDDGTVTDAASVMSVSHWWKWWHRHHPSAQHTISTATAPRTTAAAPASTNAPGTGTTTPKTTTPGGTTTGGTTTGGTGTTTTPTTPTTAAPSGTPSFPGSGSTGVASGHTLKVVNGDFHATTAGATVQDLDIRGALYVDAPDVTVKNVKVTCSNSWWIVSAKAARVTISDSTLTVDRSNPGNYCQYGITAGDQAKILRNDISFTPDGLTFSGDSAEVTGNWIHDQIAYPGKADHVDAAQLNGGNTGPFVFRGNHFSVPEQQTGCLALFADFGSIRNVVADGNLFDGAGYSVYGGTDSATQVRFTNNWFGRTFSKSGGAFGPVAHFNAGNAGNQWTDNRWLDTGQLVPAGG